MALSQYVFTQVIAPYMRGKDARGLDQLIDGIFLSSSNYKMQGQLFWIQVAAAEFAILDLLGKVAKCSAADLLGGQRRKQIDLYIANNHRSKEPEESLRLIIKSVEGIDAKALKFKIGGRMKVIDEVPNRTEKLIPMVAESLGERCTLYADANSSYLSVKKAIEVGKILEANNFAFYEEPVPFDYLDETKRVAEALDIPIAWGEQEGSQWRFKWMVENSGVRIFQPDIFYYGGLIRSLRVARMAAAKGFDLHPTHFRRWPWVSLHGNLCCMLSQPWTTLGIQGIDRRFSLGIHRRQDNRQKRIHDRTQRPWDRRGYRSQLFGES